MNNEIGFSETIIKETINGIPAIFDKISQIYKNHLNRNSFIHVCYYETKINLNIIAAIKTKELRDYVSSPAFSTLVNSFQTKALSLLMIGDDRKNYNYLLLRLNENWKKPDELESEENKEELKNKENENQKIENILDNFNFVIHKIEALKYISLIAKKEQKF